MSTEEQQILNIKVNYEDAIYGIIRYKEKLEELKKAQEELKQKYEDGKVTYDEYATSMVSIEEQSKSHKSTIRELSKEVQNNIKVEKEQEGSLKSLRAELSNATKKYDTMSKAEREGAKGQELKKHINDIADELKEAEEATQRFQRSVGSYEASIKSALGINSEFANSIMNMSAGGKGLAGIFDGAITSAKAFGTTLMGFMTNPVFLSLAGIAGVGVAFKWFFDYNKGIEESTRLTREFLGVTGDSLEAIRNDIQATADTYGKDYKETLEAVDVLTSQYGYDAKEALQIINDGFQSGADLNGDMIAKIKQYAPAFHDASIGGKELVGVIQQTRSGIFSDSGMDLIQMASKKIREMSSKTAEALESIGISSKKVEADLVSGSKSTFDVIKMISTKLKEVPQNSLEAGAVLKDVFGKQGANAGLKMIEQLDTMNIDLNKLKDTTGEYGKKVNEQREANEELNGVMSAMFDMSQKGFGSMLANAKLFVTRGIISMLKGIMNLTNKIIDLYNESAVFRGLLQLIIALVKSFGSITRGVFNVIIDAAKMAGRAMKGLAQIVEGLVTFSWSKIKEGFATAITGNFTKTLNEGFSDIKKTGSSVANNFVDGFNKTLKNKKIEHIKVSAYVEKENKSTKTNDTNTAGFGNLNKGKKKKKKKEKKKKGISAEEMAKKEEEAIRKAEDLLMQLVEQSEEQRRKAIEVQYDRQIEDVKRKLEREKGLTVKAKQALNTQIDALEKLKAKKLSEFDTQAKEETLKREETYISNMLASVEKGSKEEYDLKVKSIQTAYQLELEEARKQVMNEEDKTKLLRSITEKYYKEEEDAYKEHKNRLIDEQTKAIEERYKEKILETQIESNGTDELGVLRLQYEEKQALLEEAQQKEGETIEEFNARKLQMAWEAQQAKQAVNEKEIEVESAKYQAISQMMGGLGQVAEAFGEQSKGLAKMAKVIALGEIAVNTGVAIAEGIKQAQKAGPFPANIIAIATTVTQVMAGIASAIKTVKSAKFAKGGLVTGPGSDTSDSIPAHLSNGESVLTASATRMFAPALSAFNQIGGGVPIINNIGSNSQQMGEDFFVRAFARGMAMAPRPVVSVEEINKTNNRVETIKRLATI
nr:MAG TPA: minor tail protein [Caudoviricetes sp.]